MRGLPPRQNTHTPFLIDRIRLCYSKMVPSLDRRANCKICDVEIEILQLNAHILTVHPDYSAWEHRRKRFSRLFSFQCSTRPLGFALPSLSESEFPVHRSSILVWHSRSPNGTASERATVVQRCLKEKATGHQAKLNRYYSE